MENLLIAGTVTKDAVLRRTQSGDPVLSFSVVVAQGKDRDGNRRDGHFYDASLWGKRAEALERHITKGSKLVLRGRPTAREHNGKVYLGVNVDDLTFMGGGQQSGNQDRQGGYDQGGAPAGGGFDDRDGIPF